MNRRALVDLHDPLIAEYHEAQLVVRVEVREIFVNCPRYVHQATRGERSPFVPTRGYETPIPEWKRRDLVRDALPARDRVRIEGRDQPPGVLCYYGRIGPEPPAKLEENRGISMPLGNSALGV